MTLDVQDRIQAELARIEESEQVTILHACETGSRAWGFESTDSDYDVRFMYLRPTAWYLSIQDKRDVIERPISDDLDITGWDVPKVLELLRKSNPPLLERLQSPIVYRQESSFVKRLQDLMDEYYSPVACMYHYMHMAQNNFRQYLKGEEVWTKKYFYALRPILACRWIERGYGVVPMEFAKLVEGVLDDEKLRHEIDKLLCAKRAGEELAHGPRNPTISAFIETELERLQAEHQPPGHTRDPSTLDSVFVAILKEVNGNVIE